MGLALEERGLHPEWISLLAENSGMQRALKTGLPLPTAKIPGPRGCWNSSFPSSIQKSQPK